MPEPYQLSSFYTEPLNGHDSYALARVYRRQEAPAQAQRYYLRAVALGKFTSEVNFVDAYNAGIQLLQKENYSAAVNCFIHALLQKCPRSLTILKDLHWAGYVSDAQLVLFKDQLFKSHSLKFKTKLPQPHSNRIRKRDNVDLRKELIRNKFNQRARMGLSESILSRNSALSTSLIEPDAPMSIDEYYATGFKHHQSAILGKAAGIRPETILLTEMYAARCFLHAAAQGHAGATDALTLYITNKQANLPPDTNIALTLFKQAVYPGSPGMPAAPPSSTQSVDTDSQPPKLSQASFWAESCQIAPPTPASSTAIYVDETAPDINYDTSDVNISIDSVTETNPDIVIPAPDELGIGMFYADTVSSLSSSSEEDTELYSPSTLLLSI